MFCFTVVFTGLADTFRIMTLHMIDVFLKTLLGKLIPHFPQEKSLSSYARFPSKDK